MWSGVLSHSDCFWVDELGPRHCLYFKTSLKLLTSQAFSTLSLHTEGFPGGSVVKNPPANAGDMGDSIPFPDTGIKPVSPGLKADSLPLSHWGSTGDE